MLYFEWRPMLIVSVFAVMLTCHSFAASSSSTSSKLQVDFPPSLTKKDGYMHQRASFGFTSYAGSLSLQLIYAESDFCDPNSINTSRGYPVKKDGLIHRKPWGSWGPFVLMVDAGGMCSHVQKVRLAQRVGAAGVIIAPILSPSCTSSNIDNFTNCNTNNDLTNNDSSFHHAIMMDDGSGGDVTIPSFYMTNYNDADAIKGELIANYDDDDFIVLVQMSWFTPPPPTTATRVQYDLWTFSPLDDTFVTFVKGFRNIAIALADYTQFVPHSYIQDGSKFSCLGTTNCETLCTSNGRYCASDPDGDLSEGISGKDIVLESLRRKCIWKHYGSSWGGSEEWWNYVALFADECANPTNFTNEGCVRGIYHQVGINVKTMVQCMDDSGSLISDVSNALLDEEIKARLDFGVFLFPSIWINGVPLRDNEFSPNIVWQALCANLWNGTEPNVCRQSMSTTAPSTDQQIFETTDNRTSTTATAAASYNLSNVHITILYVIIGITSIAAATLWIKSKVHFRNMQGQVRGILAQYMTCDEQESDQQHELELNQSSSPEIRFGVVGHRME